MSNKFYVREQIDQNTNQQERFSNFAKNSINNESFFELNPNSLLYSLSLNENEKIKFVNRSDIPQFLCGFIDLTQNLDYLSPQQRIINNVLENLNIQNQNLDLLSIQPVRYVADKCLQYGVPGSYAYSNCLVPDSDLGLGAIDFASNVNFIDEIITPAITNLEDTISTAIGEGLAVQQTALAQKLAELTAPPPSIFDIVSKFGAGLPFTTTGALLSEIGELIGIAELEEFGDDVSDVGDDIGRSESSFFVSNITIPGVSF